MHEFNEDELVLFFYGELPVEMTEVMEPHIKSCAKCSGFLKTLKSASQWAGYFRPEPSGEVLESVREKAGKFNPKPLTDRFWERFRLQSREGDFVSVNLPAKVFAAVMAGALAVFLYFGVSGKTARYSWDDGIAAGIDTLDSKLAEARLFSDNAALSGFDLEYSGLESQKQKLENQCSDRMIMCFLETPA